MQRRALFGWIGAAALGVAFLLYGYPRTFPFLPADWQITRAEAEALARARFADFGGDLDDSYVVVRLTDDEYLERRLLLTRIADAARLHSSRLPQRVLEWEVAAYPSGAQPGGWQYRARITGDGEVTALRINVPSSATTEAGRITPEAARQRADELLTAQGFDLARFAEAEVRSREQRERTDHVVRYRDREALLGEEVPYGIEVTFAGDRFAGFAPWLEDPRRSRIESSLQGSGLTQLLYILVTFPIAVVVAILFLRLYHAGEVGVRRGLQIFGLVFASGVVLVLFTAAGNTEGMDFGLFSRRQVTWVWAAQMVVIYFSTVSLVTFLAWTVGESLLRRRSPQKLAAFDALFHGAWTNATVARASLRGFAAGVLLVGLLTVVAGLFQRTGAWSAVSFLFGPWWPNGALPGVTLILFSLVFGFYGTLLGQLLIAGWLAEKLGRWVGGSLAAAIGALVFFPLIPLVPAIWTLPLSLVASGTYVFLFLRYDLLTSLIANLTAGLTLLAYPFLVATDVSLQLQGGLAIAAAAAPLIVSIRYLFSGEEFLYRYDDVPPHVRRIAERERHRVELETARRIQSTILPQLPSELAGVEVAHLYLPATEVGGDFYELLALEDGRLAVAVGDVAGHGVSAGLVMSMARSALAVQVTFDPRVESVFSTLNRVIYQSARKRLLTTLCYALLDPRSREVEYASAGHLFPYRVEAAGRVEALESVAYPLGVRDPLAVRVRRSLLGRGDSLFLCSDGVVESRPWDSDDLWGFERLERSLALHAGKGARSLLQGVRSDLESFAGIGPRDDDMTILVLRLP